ncbi:hypothetical protein BD779DRAFT_1543238 [Infundibulicybe gibba]|nr:hypothetical protein BD779DRAFT_1543238 [Infundibulicybe gibba]
MRDSFTRDARTRSHPPKRHHGPLAVRIPLSPCTRMEIWLSAPEPATAPHPTLIPSGKHPLRPPNTPCIATRNRNNTTPDKADIVYHRS